MAFTHVKHSLGTCTWTAHDTPNAPAISSLIKESNDLSGNVFPSRLLVVHNTGGSGENDVTELTRWKELDDPFLEVRQANVISGGDDTSLVQAAVQLNDNLARAVVIDLLEFANITMLLHDTEKLDNDLGAGSDQDLALSGLFGVVDGVERIVED